MQKIEMSQDIEIRTSLRSLVILEGVFAVPLSICIIAASRQSSMWLPSWVLGMAALLIAIWFRTTKIEVKNGRIRYHVLLKKTKVVSIKDIEEARIEAGHLKYSDRFRSTIRLVIRPQRNSNVMPFDINLRLFERKDIDMLLSIIQSRPITTARLD